MKTDYQQEIIAKVKRLRESRGINQAQLAKDLGISPGQLGNIESYKYNHKYTLKQLSALCNMFDYSIQKLFCNDESPSYSDLMSAVIKYHG